MRAEQAELTAIDLQRQLDEQARELAEARARIAELERLLAEARGEPGEQEKDGTPPGGAQPGSAGVDEQPPDGQPGGPSGGPSPRPRSASPRPGIMEVRRQLRQALMVNAELRALIDELQRRIATLERRCAELEQQLQRAMSVEERRESPSSGQAGDAESAAGAQARAAILATELEQLRQERTEISEQCARLLSMLASPMSQTSSSTTGPSPDYRVGRTELFSQIRTELEVRDRFAQWEGAHRPRETDRRLDPMRNLDEQALVATIAVRWQLLDHAPHSFPHRARWELEGVLLDSVSEQFLTRQSRERVAYRQRIMAATAAGMP